MKLISSGEIRSRILKAIKGEEFCGGEKCLFYHECVADKRDTDCEEFIIEYAPTILEAEGYDG